MKEQERGLARKMCHDFQGQVDIRRQLLNCQIRANITSSLQEELKQLEEQCSVRVGHIGQGHRAAQQTVQV